MSSHRPLRVIIQAARSFLVLIWLISCTEEVNLVSDQSEPVPVVYSLLNPDSKEQFVRLGRTFQYDQSIAGSAPATDSTVWNLPVDVYAEEWSEGRLVRTFQFGPWTAPAKDTGFFTTDNLRVYRSEFQPLRLHTYKIYVHFPDDNRLVFGSTLIPAAPVVYDPLDLPGRKISLQSEVNYTIRWAPPARAGLYQCIFHVAYQEESPAERTFHEVLFGTDPIFEMTNGSEISWILAGNRFFQEMARQIPVNPDVARKVVNVQCRFYTGGEELALYAAPDLVASRTSILVNPYTNMENGIGIFSSLQVITVSNLELSNTTLYEIAHGELTKNLGFR